jgi:hypothetical protein
MKNKYIWLVLALVSIPSFSCAEIIPFSDDAWEFGGEEVRIEKIDGLETLFVKNGRAMLTDVVFQNGILEFDIMNDGSRGFSGIYWRMTDPGNGENFYIRPHQAGNEDANQYVPIFNGIGAWQMYFGPSYSTTVNYRVNEWIHIKIVVSGNQADVYIDSDEPVLHIGNLKHENIMGAIGVGSGFAPSYFANFSYEKMDKPELVGSPAEMKTAPEGLITNWQISESFAEAVLIGNTLPDLLVEKEKWHKLEVEDWGFANLSRIRAKTNESNTVLAKITLSTKNATVKNISFGFSDRVKVYLNGNLLYTGNNTYKTRDYRFLGTIGLFDELPLNLRKGENELIFAVSESFGGWGIMAAMENLEGMIINHK